MVNWQRQSALQYFIHDGGLSIRELPVSGKLILQASGNQETIQAAVTRAIGQDLPLLPNTCTNSIQTILWMKPTRWMIISGPETIPQIRQKLESALAKFHFMISEVSDSRTGIEVSGIHTRALMSSICALNLDSFAAGQCAQTLLVRIPLLIHQIDEAPTFHLYVDRSVARYAWDWLCDAASEFSSGENSGVNT